MFHRFRDRTEAGRRLAAQLENFTGRQDVLVLALPRGGVPVAFEVASALGCPLDVLVVRKLGVPGEPELAMGAIASGGSFVLNEKLVRHLMIPGAAIQAVANKERSELERRERAYRGVRAAPQIRGRTIIVVDDGLATGATMSAAVRALRQHQPRRIIVAVPVASKQASDSLRRVADVVCVLETPYLSSIGEWYEDFSQTSDEHVRWLLERSSPPEPAGAPTR